MIRKIGGEGVPEVVHRAVMFRTDFFVRHIDSQEDLDVIFQVLSGFWPGPAKNLGDVRCRLNVTGILRLVM